MALFHPKHESLTKPANNVGLDDKYNVPPSLNTSNVLHQVIIHELVPHEGLSPTMATSLSDNVWRFVRYSLTDISLTISLNDLNLTIQEIGGEESRETVNVFDDELLAAFTTL